MTDTAALIKRALDGMVNTDHAEDRKLFSDLAEALSRHTAPPPEEIAGLIAEIKQEMAGVEPEFADRRGKLLLKAAAALRSQAQYNTDLIAEIGVRIHEASAANDLISSQAQEIERAKVEMAMLHEMRRSLDMRIRELENQLRIRTDREEWFQRNKHLFSKGHQIAWLAALRENDLKEQIGHLEANLNDHWEGWKEATTEHDSVVKDSIKAALAWKTEHEAACIAIRAKTIDECTQKANEIADKFSGVDDPISANACHLVAKDIRALAHKDEAKTH